MEIRENKRFYRQATPSGDKPMAELNITPLIDVLLVLLVMLMLSIPLATHKVDINIPPPSPGIGEPVVNTIRLNATGTTFWNGTPMDSDRLEQMLSRMARNPIDTVLHFEAEPTARYERFDQVVAMIKRAGVQSVGFADNKQYAHWGKAK
ncbi:MAG: biopolymer transporter ExbD [Parasphingorhabdus sp.]